LEKEEKNMVGIFTPIVVKEKTKIRTFERNLGAKSLSLASLLP
jgi:hypothetical protein